MLCFGFYYKTPWIFFFFFQAEDGIRDGTVTGVQTCALPISFDRPATKTDANSARPSRLIVCPSEVCSSPGNVTHAVSPSDAATSDASRGIAEPSGIAKNPGSQLPKQRSSDTAAGGNETFRSETRRAVTGTGRACAQPPSTAEASARAVSSIAASPWWAGLTSATAPLTKRAGTPSFCSSRAEARPVTSPDSRRLLGESIVPWIAKFHSSASGAPPAVVSFSTTISWSSGLPSRLAVTAGAATAVAATSAGARARSACWTADT